MQDDAPQPKEIALRRYIEMYGAKAITGRDVLSPRLIKDMTIAENVRVAFESRAKSDNWGAWEMEMNNRELAAILKAAHSSYTSGE